LVWVKKKTHVGGYKKKIKEKKIRGNKKRERTFLNEMEERVRKIWTCLVVGGGGKVI